MIYQVTEDSRSSWGKMSHTWHSCLCATSPFSVACCFIACELQERMWVAVGSLGKNKRVA